MGLRLGCVAGATSCNESLSLDYYASTWNENQTFFFKLLPGNYTVAIRELEWNGATWEKVNEYGPRNILILNNAVTIFRLPYNTPLSISDIQSAFTISIDAPSSVFTKKADGGYQTVTINVGVNIGLIASANESLRDLRINLSSPSPPSNLEYRIYPCGDGNCHFGVVEVERLRPGDNMTLNFRLELIPTSNLAGGYVILQAQLVEAKGETTGQTYRDVFSDVVAISLCKFTELTYVKCFYFGHNWGDPNCKNECQSDPECHWIGIINDIGYCICKTDVFPRCSIP